MLKVCIAVAGAAIAGSAVIAVDKPVYDVAYELEGDMRPARTVNYNDTFESREVRAISDANCFYLSGKLRENRDPGRYPDTYLYMFDKDDNIVCQDNDSSSKGNGKASACYDVAPIPNGDDGNATIRLGITGRPDGVDAMFNGLFFNAPHAQLGEAEVCITYYGSDDPRGEEGGILGTDTYLCTFVTGAEAFRVNYVVPQGTVSVDVEIDNTTETFPICNDVDFYQLEGLSAACDYAVTVIGGTDQNCDPSCAILGWYDKNGGLVSVSGGDQIEFVDEAWPAGAQLSVISDANGRIRLAVSGHLDRNFDGWRDEGDDIVPRTIDTPGYEPPPVHGCCTCYTIKVEINKHVPDDGGQAMPDTDTMLRLANGDPQRRRQRQRHRPRHDAQQLGMDLPVIATHPFLIRKPKMRNSPSRGGPCESPARLFPIARDIRFSHAKNPEE